MKKLSSLSIFFPAYNDAESLPSLIEKTHVIAKKVADKHEIIIVNDGSKDGTEQTVRNFQKKYKTLKLINHSKNKGYGAALISGFKHARYDWIFYTDGDGQYDPSELTSLVSKVEKTVDVVNGYKLKRSDSIIRKLFGSLYNKFLHTMYSIPIRDVDCDFRLVKKSKLREIKLTSYSGSICIELIMKLQKAGARFSEVGVHHYPRMHGTSEFMNVQNLTKTFRENVKLFQSFR